MSIYAPCNTENVKFRATESMLPRNLLVALPERHCILSGRQALRGRETLRVRHVPAKKLGIEGDDEGRMQVVATVARDEKQKRCVVCDALLSSRAACWHVVRGIELNTKHAR